MSTDYQLVPVGLGDSCESMTHMLSDQVPATHMATIEITRDVVAIVRLCDACTAGLPRSEPQHANSA